MKYTNKQNRNKDMETWKRLTMARGKGARDNGGQKGKRLLKNMQKWPMYMDNGCGDCLWELGGGLSRGGQRGEYWDNCNRITIKKKTILNNHIYFSKESFTFFIIWSKCCEFMSFRNYFLLHLNYKISGVILYSIITTF